ncbi:hypothetical protein ACFQZX_11100 [Mucilaginibacter litoreus]|uniref:DUF3352 domain-containing protein n=1 Tax=Mucilaginibacter litoreus TaxID=1048221 RepID=A0ABW3ASY9_9SPHI
MKRLIALTLILVAATAYVTVKYFNNLNTSGAHAGNIIRTIPADAALVFEFTNEKSFYDIYSGNDLLNNLIGDEQAKDLDTVRKVLLGNNTIKSFFDDRNVFISVHPTKQEGINLLLTTSAKEMDIDQLIDLSKASGAKMLVTPLKIDNKPGFTIFFNSIKKRLYLINIDGGIFSASFSKELIASAAAYKPNRGKLPFMLLPDKQTANSLANLYVNYKHTDLLFEQLFKHKNIDIFKPFRLLPAQAALNINFKNDAVMFSGYTNIDNDEPASYLNIFTNQQPVENSLKSIYPSTTAYALNMAVSDVKKFAAGLTRFHDNAGLKAEREALFAKIKGETGISLKKEFEQLLGNEFAFVTTRYGERFALIAVKNGSNLRPVMTNISNMVNDDVGQFNYNKLPYFLLGDAFNAFRKPYFRVIDNYLILANTAKEIESYNDTYFNRKFLNKMDDHRRFDNLLAEKSNVSFFLQFRNAQQILKAGLKDEYYAAYKNNNLSWKKFYAASYQFAASDKNFYTNFCLLLNQPDTTANKNLN